LQSLPSAWADAYPHVRGGYNEIQKPKQRYSLIDQQRLQFIAGSENEEELQTSHQSWVEEAVRINSHQRENLWTESIAVGSKSFVETLKEELGYRARADGLMSQNQVLVRS